MSAEFSYTTVAMMTHDNINFTVIFALCYWQHIDSCTASVSCKRFCQQNGTTSPRYNVRVGCSDFWSAMFTEQVVRCDHFEG